MEELIEKLKQIKNLSELENLRGIDTNDLLLAIIKSKTYPLLDGHNVKINLDNQESFNRFAEVFLSEEDYFYYMQRNGFSLSQQDVDKLFTFVKDDFKSSQFNTFFRLFYQNKNLLNNLVIENEEYFRNYLNTPYVTIFGTLQYSDYFIKLIIEKEHFSLIDFTNNPESYSPEHLKMIANYLQSTNTIHPHLSYANHKFVNRLFSLKEEFNNDEFYSLLTLLKDKYRYEQKSYISTDTSFDIIVKENFDYLIKILQGKDFLPKCLIESTTFRDECIKRNRFDLAVQCLLPLNIIGDENLINGYAQALNISPTTLHTRLKWVENYYKKNNNLFNSMLGTSLKDDIFNLDNKHLERFVNDVEIQQSLAKLNPTQLRVISKILDSYSFKDYDISSMVTDIIDNIHSYNQLIDSLDLESLTDKQFRNLIRALQNPNNPYNTNTLFDLDNYSP